MVFSLYVFSLVQHQNIYLCGRQDCLGKQFHGSIKPLFSDLFFFRLKVEFCNSTHLMQSNVEEGRVQRKVAKEYREILARIRTLGKSH